MVLYDLEEIPDEDHEQVIGRACAIDVAKESGKVCTRVPHESRPGRRGGAVILSMLTLVGSKEEGALVESVAELLSRLRFVGRPVETLYLNETRVREGFIGQVGAIESFTRAAAKAGSVEAPVIKIGADVSSEASVTWTLHDPVAQVLVLRAALESQGLIYGLHHAKPGRYISSVGTGFISRPGMFEDLHRAGLQRHPGIYKTLEADRAKQESVAQVIEGPGKKLWLLTLIEVGYSKPP